MRSHDVILRSGATKDLAVYRARSFAALRMTPWIGLLLIVGNVCAQPPSISVIHPAEGMKLPAVSQSFVYGAITPGCALTVNGSSVAVHPQGGFLAMVLMMPGDNRLLFEVRNSSGEITQLERRFTVAEGFGVSPVKPLTLEAGSVSPQEDLWLAPGDALTVNFQGSPGAEAWFSVHGLVKHAPMVEVGSRGLYRGTYIVQPDDEIDQEPVKAVIQQKDSSIDRKSKGRVTVREMQVPRVGLVTEDIAALRTATEGGYDMFLYKGMRVSLTGKMGSVWRVQLSPTQTGWVKDSAILELPKGTSRPRSVLANMTVTRQEDSTLIKIPLEEMLPYRTEQTLDPMQLTLTFYGAFNKTELIRYDPDDTLVGLVRWKQVGPETCQVIITPRFKKWWGYDTRYEGNTLVVEIRKPWLKKDIDGMVIAVDAGHGGSELGATGPHGTREKDISLMIARVIVETLQKAGAKPFLIRDSDVDAFAAARLSGRHFFIWNAWGRARRLIPWW